MDARAVDISDANPLSIAGYNVFRQRDYPCYAPDTDLRESCLDSEDSDDAQQGQTQKYLWPKSLDDLEYYFPHDTMVSLRSIGRDRSFTELTLVQNPELGISTASR
jgi:hypothetical protein